MKARHEGSNVIARRNSAGVEWALSLGAVAGVVCIAAAVAGVFFGVTPLVFRSGSMAPAVDTGALALGVDVSGDQIVVGQVVSIVRDDGSRITHRVHSIEAVTGNSATIALKGDANAEPDPDVYVVASATRVFAHIPYAGYFVAWLSTPFAWIIGLAVSGVLMYFAFRPARPQNPSPAKHRQSESHGNILASFALVLTVAVVVGTGFSRSEATTAALQDTAVANATVTAAKPITPTGFTCTTTGTGLTNVTLSWDAIDSNHSFVLVYKLGNTIIRTDPVGAQSSGRITITAPSGLISLGDTYTVSLQSKLGEFVSIPLITRQYQTLSVVLGVAKRCVTEGSVAATPRSARIAETTPSTVAPAASPTVPATTSAPSVTTTPTATTTASATTSTNLTTTATISTTTTTTPPPPTTTPPPPPSAFVANGSSKTSGTNTASVSDGQLTVTDGSGTTVFTQPVTSSSKYGTGIVWSSTGELYALSESAGPVKISPSTDGTWAATPVDTSALPSDIAALV
jgi:signal peptidase I